MHLCDITDEAKAAIQTLIGTEVKLVNAVVQSIDGNNLVMRSKVIFHGKPALMDITITKVANALDDSPENFEVGPG